MASAAVQTLRTYLQANTDKKGSPLYDAALNKLRSLVTVSDPAGVEAAANAGKPVASFPEYLMGTKGGRFIQGVADPVVGAAQYVANETGIGDETMNNFVQRRDENIDIGREATGSEGMDWARLGGNVAMNVALTRKIPLPDTTGGRVLQGGILGLTSAASTPAASENYESQKNAQMGIGLLAGAAFPAALSGLSWAGNKAKDIISMVHPIGIEGNARRAVLEAAGSRADDVLTNLDANVNPVAQGSVAEVASPAGSAELSALMRAAEARNGSGMVEAQNATNAARVSRLREVWTPERLAAAEATRTANANTLYPLAFEQAAMADDTLREIFKNPFAQDAFPAAIKLAKDAGIKIENGEVRPEDLTQFIQFMKESMDTALSRSGDTSLGRADARAVMGVKTAMMNWLDNANDAFKTARTTFAADSDPINRMQVAQYVENKLVPALNDFGADAPQRATVFAQAMRDAPGTIRRATGNDIEDTMEGVFANDLTALARINSVGDDLARSANTDRLARAGAERAAGIAGDIGRVPQAHILERTLTIANSVLNRLGKKAQESTLDYLETISRDPVKFAAMMRGASPQQRAAINEIMQAARIAVPVTATQGVE